MKVKIMTHGVPSSTIMRSSRRPRGIQTMTQRFERTSGSDGMGEMECEWKNKWNSLGKPNNDGGCEAVSAVIVSEKEVTI